MRKEVVHLEGRPVLSDADLTMVYQRSRTGQPASRPEEIARSRVTLAPVLYDRGPHPRQDARVAVWLFGVAAIVLLLPGLALLKEWAYAGVTFALVMATISSYDVEGGVKWIFPLVLLVLVAVSYLIRPANRRLAPGPSL